MIRPVGRNVLIKPFKDEVMFKGTLHLPDTRKAKASDGVILAVGQWCSAVKPGEWVVFSRRQAHDVEGEHGEALVIVDERAIAVALEDESEAGGGPC